MGTTPNTDEVSRAADRVATTAADIRRKAAALVRRDGGDADGEARDRAARTADALGRISDSLEALAEGARKSGLVLRDRGRDGARALERGERTLREGGFLGAGARLAVLARRNAAVLVGGALATAAVVALLRRTR